jgi:hypothetical protein
MGEFVGQSRENAREMRGKCEGNAREMRGKCEGRVKGCGATSLRVRLSVRGGGREESVARAGISI